jgi:hypothetical protein
MIWYHSYAVGSSVDQSPIRQERVPAPPRGGPMARRGHMTTGLGSPDALRCARGRD